VIFCGAVAGAVTISANNGVETIVRMKAKLRQAFLFIIVFP
jgi:hypothetical protein